MACEKKYGLILPDKNKPQKPIFQASRNVFGDAESDEEEPTKKAGLLRPSHNINRQAKSSQNKALLEDPTVYQYDEIYDSMVSSKETKNEKKKEEKRPQYIENLLKAANKRKIENERRMERQIQKEREKEGDEFADKEVFVTTAYKKKLEEMQKEEEKEKREEYLESIGDVRKQGDLSGFYRHLYEQKLGSDKVLQNKEEGETTSEACVKTPEAPNETDQPKIKKQKEKTSESSKRNYRKRKTSEANNELSDGEIIDSDDEVNRVNLKAIRNSKQMKNNDDNIDADSDFSVDDPSSEEEEPIVKKHVAKDLKPTGDKNEREAKQKSDPPSVAKSSEKSVLKDKDLNKEEDAPKEKKPKPEAPPVPQKPKVDIWKKRTVGEALDQAIQRYYVRKAARGL